MSNFEHNFPGKKPEEKREETPKTSPKSRIGRMFSLGDKVDSLKNEDFDSEDALIKKLKETLGIPGADVKIVKDGRFGLKAEMKEQVAIDPEKIVAEIYGMQLRMKEKAFVLPSDMPYFCAMMFSLEVISSRNIREMIQKAYMTFGDEIERLNVSVEEFKKTYKEKYGEDLEKRIGKFI